MATKVHQREFIECRTPEGRILATVEIISTKASNSAGANAYPVVLVPIEEANSFGEEQLQIRERGRYEYRLQPAPGAPPDLALLPGRGVQPSRVESSGEDRGLIEPGDHCGFFPLVIIRRGDPEEKPLALGSLEVQSLKLGYREHFRGMLSFIAKKSAALLLDCRAPTRLRLSTLWKNDPHILEQQLEFLRHTLGSSAFQAAVDQVLRNPHRRLEEEPERRSISRPFKSNRDIARQISVASRRVAVPPHHPLHRTLASLPAHLTVKMRSDFLDTAENRFVKMALTEFRDFLAEVADHIKRDPKQFQKPENKRLLREANRLQGLMAMQLTRGFLPDVSLPTVIPVGSPVLQRKTGYSDILHSWLQFHTSAQLAWDGGREIFRAGSRNVATLYEYWLFFQLESLFRQKFSCDQPLHALVINKKKTPPQLVLQRGVELETPVVGAWSKSAGRNLARSSTSTEHLPGMPIILREVVGLVACAPTTPSVFGPLNIQNRTLKRMS